MIFINYALIILHGQSYKAGEKFHLIDLVMYLQHLMNNFIYLVVMMAQIG